MACQDGKLETRGKVFRSYPPPPASLFKEFILKSQVFMFPKIIPYSISYTRRTKRLAAEAGVDYKQ